MNKAYYKSLDFFMMRNPILSFESYKKIFCDNIPREEFIEKLISISKNPIISEAILISSTSLNQAIDRLNSEKNIVKKEQIISSILKYFIRMTSRTTPYGLFSGVTTGKFGESTILQINNIKKHNKRSRPDMEWLYGIMKMIEQNQRILRKLKLKSNTLCLDNGIRLDMPYISNYGQIKKDLEESSLSASIRFTSPVKLVMNEAKELIPFEKLFNKILEANPGINENIVENFINQLLENEYLITDIRTPLINKDPLSYVIEKIKNIEEASEIHNKLLNIKTLIDNYNKLSIGEGINEYKDLTKLMKEIFECDNYLQVDLAIDKENIVLCEKIKEEIIDTIEFLISISTLNGEQEYIKSYKEEFMEFYGMDREVPVLELLDEDKGLGAPATYTTPFSSKQVQKSRKLQEDEKFYKFIIREVERCILKGDKEVVLKKENLKLMGCRNIEDIKFHEMPKSIDYYTFLSAKNYDELNSGNFRMSISPNPGIAGAGRTFGRFIDILGDDIHENMKIINEEEKKLLGNDYVIAEIVELPQSGRVSNVTLNWNAKDYEMVIADNYSENKKKLEIKDLYIGIDGITNKFYIRSKSLNKRVIAASSHMLNIMSGSNIYRFLREISQYDTIEVFQRIYENGLENFSYIPRIVYNRTIIMPATWRISLDELGITKTSSLEKFKSIIENWRKEYNVPSYVYEKDSDNRLLLNLNNPIHVEELFNILKARGNADVILNEVEVDIDNLLLKGEDGGYFSEFVFPLILNKEKYIENKSIKEDVLTTKYDYVKNHSKLNTLNDKRQVFIGDEWIYLKLYGNYKRIDEFLGFELLDFCNSLKEENLIDKFFFLRYADPQSHIRLRLKCKKVDEDFINILNKWFKHLRDEGLLTKVVFDTYFKEVERYGGEELIELAEDVFYKDSLLILNVINLLRVGKLDMDIVHIAMVNIVNMLEGLGIDYELQKKVFENRFDQSKYRDIFKKDRKKFMSLINSQNNWESLRKIENGETLYNLFEINREALENFKIKLEELDNKKQLWNSKDSILFSLTHMHCNRLIGNNMIEEEIMHLIRHSLHAIEYLRKKNSGD